MKSDEREILELARKGDRRSFRWLYDHYVDSLYRFLLQFEPIESRVEEWVQRAFIKGFERLGSFDGRSRFGTWLFSIALNEMKMDRRRYESMIIFPLDNKNIAGEEPHLEFEWDEAMCAVLDTLDEQKRMVFVLYEVEGYSHGEIAAILGIGESTSRATLTRTKSLLKQLWKAEEKRA